MTRRFTALHVIAVLLRVAAVVVAVVGLLGFCGLTAGFLFSQTPLERMPMMRFFPRMGFMGLFVLVASFVQALLLYAAGEGIELLLALEENTRTAATRLAELTGRQPGEPPPG